MMTVSTTPVPPPANDAGLAPLVRFLGLDFQPMNVDDVAAKLAREASVDTPFYYVAVSYTHLTLPTKA